MTKIYLNTIIPNILESFTIDIFQEYLINEGYNKIENISTDYIATFYKETLDYEDIVYITKVDGNQIYYSSTFTDSGNIIDFVKHRIEIDGTYDEFNPLKNNTIEACKKLINFLKKEKTIENSKSNFKELSKNDFLKIKKNSFTLFHDAKEIDNSQFLNDKGIIEETIEAPIFNRKIYSTRGLTINNDSYDITNTVFPLYDHKLKEIGLTLMNTIHQENEIEEDIYEALPGSDIDKGFWISNDIRKNKRSKIKLTFVDSPLEALAHYQMYDEERLYISFFKKTNNSFDIIHEIIEINKASLNLSLNITLKNIIFELELVIHILNKKGYPITFEIENGKNLDIKIGDCKELKSFIERIQRINTRLISGIIESLGEDSKKILQNDIIRSTKEGNSVIFRVPKSLQLIYNLTKNIVSTFPSSHGVSVEKSTKFSWLDLNKKYPKDSIKALLKSDAIFGYKYI